MSWKKGKGKEKEKEKNLLNQTWCCGVLACAFGVPGLRGSQDGLRARCVVVLRRFDSEMKQKRGRNTYLSGVLERTQSGVTGTAQ